MSGSFADYLLDQSIVGRPPAETDAAEDQLVASQIRQQNDETLPASPARAMAIGGMPNPMLSTPLPPPTGGEDQVIPAPSTQPAQPPAVRLGGELFTLGDPNAPPPPMKAPDWGTAAVGGLARGGVSLVQQTGDLVATAMKKTGDWTGQDWLKHGGQALEDWDKQAKEAVDKSYPLGDMSLKDASSKGVLIPWIIDQIGEQGVPVGAILASARASPMIPIIYGALVGANEEAKNPNSTPGSILYKAATGGAMMGIPLGIAHSAAGMVFWKRLLAQATELTGFGAGQPFVEGVTPALRTGGAGYQMPTAEQVVTSAAAGALATPAMMAGTRLLYGKQGPQPKPKPEGSTEDLPSDVDPDAAAALPLALPAPTSENRPPIMFTMPTGPDQVSPADIVPPAAGTVETARTTGDIATDMAITRALPAPTPENRPPVVPLPGRVAGTDVIPPAPGTVDYPPVPPPAPLELPGPTPENRPPVVPLPGRVAGTDVIPPAPGTVDYPPVPPPAPLELPGPTPENRPPEGTRVLPEPGQVSSADVVPPAAGTVEYPADRARGGPPAPGEPRAEPPAPPTPPPPRPAGGEAAPAEPVKLPAPPGTPEGHTFENDDTVPGQVVLKNPQGHVVAVGDNPEQALTLLAVRARARGEPVAEAAPVAGGPEAAPLREPAAVPAEATTTGSAAPEARPAGSLDLAGGFGGRVAEEPAGRSFGVEEVSPGRWGVTGPDGTRLGSKTGYTSQERAQAVADRARQLSSADNKSTDAALVVKAASILRGTAKAAAEYTENVKATQERIAAETPPTEKPAVVVEVKPQPKVLQAVAQARREPPPLARTPAELATQKAATAAKVKAARVKRDVARDLEETSGVPATATPITRGEEGGVERAPAGEAKAATETRTTETVGENKESAYDQIAKSKTDMVEKAEALIADHLKDPGMRTPGEIYDAYGEPTRKGGRGRRFDTFLQYLHDKITGIEKGPSDKTVITDANTQVNQIIENARKSGKSLTKVQEGELWQAASDHILNVRKGVEETLPALRKLRSQIIGELSSRSGTDKASKIHSDADLARIEKEGDKGTYGSPDITASRRAMHEESPSVNLQTWGRADTSAQSGTPHDLHDYLNDIIDSPGVRKSAPHFVALARILRRAIRPGIEVYGDYDQRGAVYNESTDSIHINPDMPTPTQAILHETLHSGTVEFLKNIGGRLRRGDVVTPRERQIYESLDALGRELTRMRANMDEADVSLKYALDYALSTEGGKIGRFQDHEELVTMMMTDPHVMDAMAREQASPVLLRELRNLDMMPSVPRRPTLYDAFKAIVGRIFGLTPDRVSVLDAALRPLTETLQAGTRFRNRQLDEAHDLLGFASGKYFSPDTKITDRLPGDLPEKLSELGDRLKSFGNDGFVGAANKAAETSRQWFEREARTRKAGAGISAQRAANELAMLPAPTTMIAEWHKATLPEVRDLARARSMQEEARGGVFSRWGDRVKGWVSDLKNAGDAFEHLRNEVSRVEADVIHGDHSNVRPENLGYARELQARYDKLPERQKTLFRDLTDYHATTGHDERQAWMEHIVDRVMGGGIDEAVRRDPSLGQSTDRAGNPLRTPEERANAIRTEIANIARSKEKLTEMSRNPDGSDLSKLMGKYWEPSRDVIKMLATVQSRGWRQGNFTSLQRHGDYLVVHGDRLTGDKYGVHRFERPGEAKMFRDDFKKTHPKVEISDVRLIDDTHHNEFLSQKMQVDMQKALDRAGIKGDAAEEIKRSLGSIMMQHGINTMAARYAARRRNIYGASKNGAMNLVRDLGSHSSRMGYLAHAAEETRAYNDLDKRVRQIEQSRRPGTNEEIAASQKRLDAAEEKYKSGDPAYSQAEIEDLRQQHQWLQKPPEGVAVTARQVLKELESRRLPLDHDDTARRFGAAAKKFTSASFVLHLMRPAHLAVQVADAQSMGLSYLGGAHGFARAGAALTKNLARLAPPGMRAGGRAMFHAVTGQLKQADWLVSKAYERRLVDSGMHAGEAKALMTEANHWGMINQSMEREIQRTAKDGFGFGGGPLHVTGNMMDLFAAAEHMTDSVNRMAILASAYELKKIDNGGRLNDGTVDHKALAHAIDITNMAMPNYGAWNKPRLASERGPLGPLGSAAMQYKIYGMNMYSGMAVLARNAWKNPEQRAVALKSLAGIFATHALLVGVTANMFGVPLNVATGLWDLVSGEPGPHNYENDLRRWMTEHWGPTWSTLVSRGALGAAGVDLHRSLKITNATDLPGPKTFDRQGVAGMIAQGLTGASGDVAEQMFDAAHQIFTGHIQKGIIAMLPRVAGDVLKARQMATEGLTDSRGRVIAKPSQFSAGDIALQTLGFNPQARATFYDQRAAGQEFHNEYAHARDRAEQRYVQSGGKDRAGVLDFNKRAREERAPQITPQNLLEAMKRSREMVANPATRGLRIPKNMLPAETRAMNLY